MKMKIGPRRKCWSGEFFSAKYFLVRAVALVVLFLAAQLSGLRDYTTFLSGTTANAETGMYWSSLYGTAYIVLYLGCVVVTPILLLAAGFLTLWQRWRI